MRPVSLALLLVGATLLAGCSDAGHPVQERLVIHVEGDAWRIAVPLPETHSAEEWAQAAHVSQGQAAVEPGHATTPRYPAGGRVLWIDGTGTVDIEATILSNAAGAPFLDAQWSLGDGRLVDIAVEGEGLLVSIQYEAATPDCHRQARWAGYGLSGTPRLDGTDHQECM